MAKRWGKIRGKRTIVAPRTVSGAVQWGPFPWDGIQTLGGGPPKVEVNSWVEVISLPEDEKTGDTLGFVPETVAMVGGTYEVLVIKIMIHPMKGRQFIYGLHYLEQNKLQYFWPWNIKPDKGR